MILYRLISPLIGLAYVLRSLWGMVRGSEGFADVVQRFGGPAIDGPTVWIHGASVGEMNAARPVITALAAKGPVLVTATTLTGRSTVRRWNISGVTARIAPLDWAWVTRAVLRRAHVKGLVIVENELWPVRILTAHQAGLPVVMINGRMSENSARTWRKFPRLAQAVLSPMALIAPQDAGSAARLTDLGAQTPTDPVNLKGLYAPDFSAIPAQLTTFKRDKTVLAAATHQGEEAIVLDAFKSLRKSQPDLELIIAPRHPTRGQEVGDLSQRCGFSTAYRSSDDTPNTDIYIADTLGEMHMWYRLAGCAFIGGSLVNKGGHTPFEPAAYGCPIIHGPHVGNFTDSYATLNADNAAIPITNAASLALAIQNHMNDEPMAERAKAALDQPDLAPLLAQIDAALDPSAQTRL